MQERVLLVYLLLGAVGALSNFLVLLPAELHTDTPEKVCVLLHSRNDSIALKLTIDHEHQNLTLLELDLVGNSHSCFNFTVEDRDLGLDFWRSVLLTVTVTGSGENISFNKTKKVLLKRHDSLTFVQTDKPIYKPGQTVRFRIVTLDENFIPIQEKYSLVSMWDPRGNQIGQWKDVEPQQGITDLTFDLIPEPLMGSYKIQVQKRQNTLFHKFLVEEYVLPKFELKIDFPKKITILDTTIHIKVCGRYTFGKPALGHINGTVCRHSFYHAAYPDRCHRVFGETDSDGCLSRDLSTAKFHLKRGRYNRDIHAVFILEVEGGGIALFSPATCNVINEITQINFEEVEDYFKKGLPYTGQLRIKYSTGGPIENTTIYVFNSMTPGAQKIISDQDGIGKFSFDTSSWTLNPISFMAIYRISYDSYNYPGTVPRHESARHRAKCFYSKSNSYLSIRKHSQELPCDTELEVTVDYIIKGVPEDEEHVVDVSYLVMARGLIITFAKKTLSVGGPAGSQGEFSLTLQVSADIAPVARILVFIVLPDGETVADSKRYRVTECFRNKVSLQFSVPEELPSGHLSLDLQASPGSLCAIRVVDQSVLLLKPEKELSQHSVYSLLPVRDLSGYPYPANEDNSEFCVPGDSAIVSSSDSNSVEDVAGLLQDMGLKILTDTKYHVPLACVIHLERMGAMPEIMDLRNAISLSHAEPTVKVRQYFPETWIWDLIPVGTTGTASLPLTVPDSITEWKGSMFCTGDVGLGLSDTISLNAFKPFFVDLSLPYSIIRTESFKLKAKVFNYLAQCIMVQVTLIEAHGFEVTSDLSTGYQNCVCSKESVTFGWNLKATGLGEQNVTVRAESIASKSLCGNEVVTVPVKGAVDVIRKPLLIQPEGTETELTHSSFLCPGGETIFEEIHLQVPEDVVEGSSRAYITVLGDILGSAMENLDGLLKLPTGCGEQNMVKFAPNIYVQRYLVETNQLTREVQTKAIGFLKTGYQRQLTFKHRDGSFSAFGGHDTEGNTWLTAFVLKSFLQARSYIFIDDSILRQSTRFFLKYRMQSGCFASLGTLFNNAMKGGVDDHISLSAYVTTTLLELAKIDPELADQVYRKWLEVEKRNSDIDHQFTEQITTPVLATVVPTNNLPDFKTGVTDGALGCLRQALKTVNSTYTLALLAYTFTLAQDQVTRDQILIQLEARAIKQDGLTHWQREEEKGAQEERGFWWQAPSAEVEMTAYVLLALLSKPQVTSSDMDQAIPVVSWLIRQRNSYGGFASTQDTVVALQALSLYARLTHVSDPHNSLTLSSEAGFHSQIHIHASNQLLLQRQCLRDIPGNYSVRINGTSCLLLQTTLRYNRPPAQKDSVFTLSVEMVNDIVRLENGHPRIDINVTYTGERPVSNMVIIDVKILSGYSLEKKFDKLVRDNGNISKLEVRDDHMLLYIESMESNRLLQLSIDAIYNFKVENLQPAFVKVYDYYETDDAAIAEYHEQTIVEVEGSRTRGHRIK